MKIRYLDINGVWTRLRWDPHWDYWYLSRPNARALCGGRFNPTVIFVVAGVPCRCAQVILGGRRLHRLETICEHSRQTLTRALLSMEK